MMKRRGHKSHVSGWTRFQRVFRKQAERKDLAQYMQKRRSKKGVDK